MDTLRQHGFALFAGLLFAAAVVLGMAAGRTWASVVPRDGARARDPAGPAVPGTGRGNLPEKRVLEQLPPPAPRPDPLADAPRGIVQERQSLFRHTVNVRNQWQDVVGAEWVNVLAGALVEDPRQGVVAVSSDPVGSTTASLRADFYPTPRREGAVKFVAADGLRLTVRAETGATFVFDVAQRTYVAASAPAPAPTIPPATSRLLARSASSAAEPASGAAPAGTRMCTAENLAAVHVGRPEPEERRLLGHLLLTNQAARGCILYGWAQSTELLDTDGRILPLEHRANGDSTPSDFVLAPGQAARMEVWWQNWCQPAPEGPLRLVVSPSQGGGKLAVPLEGGAPQCSDPSYPSFLLVGPFQPWDQ